MILDSHILQKLDEQFFPTPDSVQRFLGESKDIRDLSLTPGRQAIVNVFQERSDRSSASLDAFGKLQAQYLKKLSSLLDKTSSGKLNLPSADREASNLLVDYFRRSFLLGRGSTESDFLKHFPLSDEEDQFIKSAASTELGFAKRFLRQSKNSGQWNAFRAGMYARTLESIFTSGWVASLPDGTKIWWILNAKESCPDCIRLAKGGPYRISKGVSSLPTVPRSGFTRCLSNCKCELRVELPTKKIKPETPELFLDKPPVFVDSPNSGFVSLVERKYAEMNYIRQRMVLEKVPKKLTALIQRRRVLNSEIVELQKSSPNPFIAQFSISDIQKAALQVIDLPEVSFSDIQKGDNLAVLKNSFSIPSTVKKVTKKFVELINPYGTIKLTPDSWAMFFRLGEK